MILKRDLESKRGREKEREEERKRKTRIQGNDEDRMRQRLTENVREIERAIKGKIGQIKVRKIKMF